MSTHLASHRFSAYANEPFRMCALLHAGDNLRLKTNFKCPEDILLYNTDREAVRNVGCKAGDLIIFMETTIHGSLP